MLVANRKRLFVEGELDAALIRKLIAEVGVDFLVEEEGSKDGLKAKVIDAREKARRGGTTASVFYLRDRDYDFDVSAETSVAREIVDQTYGVIGWHWCRHEIENYLLEPAILHAYLVQGKPELTAAEVVKRLCEVALAIREYQAARRTLGVSKRRSMLPPPYDLGTRPRELRRKEIALPRDVGMEACRAWVMESARGFQERVMQTLDEENVRQRYEEARQEFSKEKCKDITWVLQMFSGKDLFAALDGWFQELGLQGAKDARNKLEQFVTENPGFALEVLPEWRVFMEQLKRIE